MAMRRSESIVFMAAMSSSTITGASPSNGSSSSISAGLVMSARDREHLLLASGQLVAHVAATFGETGKKRENGVEIPRPRPRRDRQILLDRQRGENCALLRDPADAVGRAAIGRHARNVLAAPRQPAGAQLRVAQDGQQQR